MGSRGDNETVRKMVTIMRLIGKLIVAMAGIAIIYPFNVVAWEKWEQKLIKAGCHRFEEKPVDKEYIRCFKEQFRATGSGKEKIKLIEKVDASIYACAEDSEYRSCEISLINGNEASGLPLGFT